MEIPEMKRLYFLLISDSREGVALAAEQSLSEVSGRGNDFAIAGRCIRDVLTGQKEASELQSAVDLVEGTPESMDWQGFAEVSAQVILKKANSIENTTGGLALQLKLDEPAQLAAFARDAILKRHDADKIIGTLPDEVGKLVLGVMENSAFKNAVGSDERFSKHVNTFGKRLLRGVAAEIERTSGGGDGGQDKAALTRYGLLMAGKAFSHILPLSDRTIEFVKGAKGSGEELDRMAGMIIERNERLKGDSKGITQRKPPSNPPKRPGRRKTRT